MLSLYLLRKTFEESQSCSLRNAYIHNTPFGWETGPLIVQFYLVNNKRKRKINHNIITCKQLTYGANEFKEWIIWQYENQKQSRDILFIILLYPNLVFITNYDVLFLINYKLGKIYIRNPSKILGIYLGMTFKRSWTWSTLIRFNDFQLTFITSRGRVLLVTFDFSIMNEMQIFLFSHHEAYWKLCVSHILHIIYL